MDLWRISNEKSLAGKSGLKYAARWNSAGRRIVYLAESPAGAMVEVLVHLELEEDEMPEAYQLLRIGGSPDLPFADITVPAGEAWKTNHGLTRSLGDQWLSGGKTALARVPCAILRSTFNFLLNPLHSDAGRLQILEAARADFDLRLFRHLQG